MEKLDYSRMLEKIHFVIESYKENFKQINEEERYKWEAIGWYKQHWDINADDFSDMLANAFSKAHNLLTSGMYFAYKVLVEFAQDYPEEARTLFIKLHDESLPLESRFSIFKARFDERLKELQKVDSKVKNHSQDLRAVMLYLTFEYPETYYLYKYTMFDEFSKRVGYISNELEEASAVQEAENFMKLCAIVLEEVKKDDELIAMSKERLDESCYQDEALHLLTMDIIFYGSESLGEKGWLLTWNPANWEWKDFEKCCNDTKMGQECVLQWTCQNKSPEVGDHVFLMKLGKQPKGIMAHGRVTKKSYEAPHFNPNKAAEGKVSNRIDVKFDWIQNVEKHEDILSQEYLQKNYKNQKWNPQASGIEIKKAVLDDLLQEWAALTKKELDEFWPSLDTYSPNISAEQYAEIFRDEFSITPEKLDIIYFLWKMGSTATCKQIAEIYGKTYNHYNANAYHIGKAVHNATKCKLLPNENGVHKYWPILFVGRNAKDNEPGTFVWKLREPVEDAIKILMQEGFFNSMNVVDVNKKEKCNINTILYGPPGTGKTHNTAIYAVAICDGEDIETVKGWKYEKVMERYKALLTEERVAFTTFHQSYSYEDFIEGIKPVMVSEEDAGSDVQYSVKPGVFKRFCERANRPLAMKKEDYGVCDNPTIWKVSLQGTGDNPVRTDCLKNGHIRIGIYSEGNLRTSRVENSFINKMKIGDIVLSCYTESTIDAIGVITGDYEESCKYTEYPLLRKVNWIIKGVQEDILLINGGAKMTLAAVHGLPRVSLEDVYKIIEKYSPSHEADVNHKQENYVFIIDEINRGNISKIFGELITLIEDSKRAGKPEEASAILPYSGKKFSVPQNVYIIGTMNTADRSIALMDTALRRRFSFVEMMPDAELLKGIEIEGIDIAKMLDAINKRITYLYDREHTIGHAFFMELRDEDTIEKLAEIFEKQIIPLLQEYFYEDYQKIQLVLGDNGKEDTYKFILDEPITIDKIFKKSKKGNAESELDIKEKNYTINKKAFSKAQSYIEIYQ